MNTFDYVRIYGNDGERVMNREDWLALSSVERVRQFLFQRLQFVRDGEVIPAADAIGWLHLTGSFGFGKPKSLSV